MDFYTATFAMLTALTGFLELSKRSEDKLISQPEFRKFRFNYVVVYSMMMAGDWLQGPYVYALYQHYGFARGDIGRLFIAGFGSSLFFGTIVGSLADKHGRKLAALTYCVVYILSCVTKHWNDYHVLLIGRVLGGIATSLLWSAFESWLVSEHLNRGFDPEWLGSTFSKAVYIGNGLMAILSGLAANFLVENVGAGFVSPFDAASVVLILGGAMISATWPENYGDGASQGGVFSQLRSAMKLIASDRRILLLGAIQGLFEGSMYTFIFLWTPALSPNDEHIPHGLIFATFMVACMAGSALAGVFMAKGMLPEHYMQWGFVMASMALFVPVAIHAYGQAGFVRGGVSAEAQIQMVAFCMFEAVIGLFWPSMMKMRSQYVPNEKLSTIINCFRIPVNLFVCLVLYEVSDTHLEMVFCVCASLLLICAVLQRALAHTASLSPDAVKSALRRATKFEALSAGKVSA
mmetsp:Transcript_37996/g.107327  ORF Transcript_37996/g.107327 Transcript_37996/m.107327 type:complete len:462 (+) Transcript_37996:526-1911(+)|eukprot:CAMPEP_0117654676 /NCGR_PEP_ID=MMETSP0804-20121206/3873_1 /TAXON_ID=1074897 /ORGANISM="Tetraselmis astigmatica, Strain CCMP880" /LENGTH=461 /DNA_ID=CAMNT_0005460977 /DNA_START=446 /DNA_END=1831 /DNA_ORIENTATION=-